MSFRIREGFKSARDRLQISSFDKETTRKIWDVVSSYIRCLNSKESSQSDDKIFHRLNEFYTKVNVEIWGNLREDTHSLYSIVVDFSEETYYLSPEEYSTLKDWWFRNSSSFGDKMEIVEFLCHCFYKTRHKFGDEINELFNQLMVGYRVKKNEVVPVSSNEELESVEQASKETKHIDIAITQLKNLDYPNSIKESLLAAEDVCKEFLGDKSQNTLGKNLSFIKEKYNFSSTVIEVTKKLYDAANSAKDVRHKGNKDLGKDQEEARYFLITCSAFINYLKGKK